MGSSGRPAPPQPPVLEPPPTPELLPEPGAPTGQQKGQQVKCSARLPRHPGPAATCYATGLHPSPNPPASATVTPVAAVAGGPDAKTAHPGAATMDSLPRRTSYLTSATRAARTAARLGLCAASATQRRGLSEKANEKPTLRTSPASSARALTPLERMRI